MAASQAEKIAGGGKQPDVVKDAVSAVEQAAERNARGIIEDQSAGRFEGDADLWLREGTYAYAYVPLDDDSALCVYVRGHGQPVEFEAFEDMESASRWHPTRSTD